MIDPSAVYDFKTPTVQWIIAFAKTHEKISVV